MGAAAPDVRAALELAAREVAEGNVRSAEQRCRGLETSDPALAGQRGQLLGLICASEGRHEEAAAAFREALGFLPDNPGAAFGLGYSLNALGRAQEAAAHLERAAALAPEHADAHRLLGEVLLRLDRGAEAIACYERAVALDPEAPDLRNDLGVALLRGGRHDAAVGCFRSAFEMDPEFAEAALNLGKVLAARREPAAAGRCFEQVLGLEPGNVQALCLLGESLLARRDNAGAAARYACAVERAPDLAAAHLGLGRALIEQGDFDAARESLRRALALDAGLAAARNALGIALWLGGMLGEAETLYRELIAAQPGLIDAHLNLGNVLQEARRLDEAEACFRRGLELDPASASAHFSLGTLLLLRGDYMRGWAEYEWRWRLADEAPLPDTGRPLWGGEDLAGRTILLDAEQGLGDTLQFVRYAPLLAALGARVILRCPPPLARLLGGVEGVAAVVDGAAPLPPFDCYCPLMSLPLRLATTLETVPAGVPYLHADPRLAARWRARLAESDHGAFRVGLVWAGSRPGLPGRLSVDSRRSVTLAELAPLAAAAGTVFYSLQKGATAAQVAHPPAGMRLADYSAELGDFSDTAALVANLDLVITVDTSVAHLAGGLGKPVWILSRFDGCWRWLLDREDSPWYPGARLFRQRRPGDWSDAIERLAAALREAARRRA